MQSNEEKDSGMTVRDKRRVGPEGVVTEQLPADAPEAGDAVAPGVTQAPPPGAHEASAHKHAAEDAAEEVLQAQKHLEDLQRLQAEFANYRKRMMREQASSAERGARRLVEKLLPVLDDFERALGHGPQTETSSNRASKGQAVPTAQAPWAGIELVFDHLQRVLSDEGLEEIPSEGVPFDPTVHEAVDVTEDPGLSETIAARLYRKGYRFNGQVMRAAMVGVARPPERDAGRQPNATLSLDAEDASAGSEAKE
jgi:molecular chaperone GrpE